MIDFKEELKKFKPIMEIDHVEESVLNNEIHDLLEILQDIDKKARDTEKETP